MQLTINEKIQAECSWHTIEYITEAPAARSFTLDSVDINFDRMISMAERVILKERNKNGCRSYRLRMSGLLSSITLKWSPRAVRNSSSIFKKAR